MRRITGIFVVQQADETDLSAAKEQNAEADDELEGYQLLYNAL